MSQENSSHAARVIRVHGKGKLSLALHEVLKPGVRHARRHRRRVVGLQQRVSMALPGEPVIYVPAHELADSSPGSKSQVLDFSHSWSDSRARTPSNDSRAISSTLSRVRSPRAMRTAEPRSPRRSARARTTARFAWPFTARARIHTSRLPSS